MTSISAKRQVWQLSSGPASRSYADVFLQNGVGLIGPGDAGAWNPNRSDEEFEGGFVRRFAAEMRIADIVLLRTGASSITAVGLIASEYQYFSAFDDVNGWDLQHGRRVRWCKLPREHVFDSAVFGGSPPRCSQVWSEEVCDYAMRFINSPPTLWQQAALPGLPAEESMLDEIPSRLAAIIAKVQDLVPLYWDRERFGEHPTEDELVAHLVVPFFRALGWPPERIGVKWHYIDVALFADLPRSPATCRFVIEAKRLGAGVEGALGQAMGYVETLGEPCDIVVTDGIRYRLYSYAAGYGPTAYANLGRLKQSASQLFDLLKGH